LHAPIWQVVPPPQRMPHAPQLSESLCGSTHEAPHSIVPLGQAETHWLFAQNWPEAHEVEQLPQRSGLDVRSTHTPSHEVWPGGHVHWPLWQVVPARQTVPQPPQLLPSLARFTHAREQLVSPMVQVTAH
jgi:hypothetical protein